MLRKGRIIEWVCKRCGEKEFLLVLGDGEVIRPINGMEVFLPLEELKGQEGKTGKGPYTYHLLPNEEGIPWAPGFALKSKEAMAVYGVMLPVSELTGGINRELYANMYLQKIVRLIETWDGEPLPVIFDRYFAAPYIGSGEPRDVAMLMWQELDEVRRPVLELSSIFDGKEHISKLEEEEVQRLRDILDTLRLDEFLGYLTNYPRG